MNRARRSDRFVHGIDGDFPAAHTGLYSGRVSVKLTQFECMHIYFYLLTICNKTLKTYPDAVADPGFAEGELLPPSLPPSLKNVNLM